MAPLLNPNRTLGILTCERPGLQPPFSEAAFFSQLTTIGRLHNLRVIILHPDSIDWQQRTVTAWHHNSNAGTKEKWSSQREPLPSLLYDRCYYRSREQHYRYRTFIQRLRQDPQVRFLGRPLAGKWKTYQLLQTQKEILPFLPLTELCENTETVIEFLQQHTSALLKPDMSSLGRGVVAIECLGNPSESLFQLRGRTFSNETFHRKVRGLASLRKWITSRLRFKKHIVQTFLPLQTPSGKPFDIRLLVQKNERWQFNITGAGVRIGKPHTITANLHGGGQVEVLARFLSQHYPTSLRESIYEQFEKIGNLVPGALEATHGKLVELGIDIGLDPGGRAWLLEVNSKPGRAIFLHTAERAVRRKSIHLPIRYAASLLTQMHGGA
ncbi:YheC/YheD family protein [Pasteuria penetrans]|uniref:YheC/YheD family endospore coat-associated protein n=1 Tax=Pasteuria penetrans TaxID=86005 RepID=UPI000FA838DC|nr:YheC/YheD family protein [Pasteuria penetrans]